MINTWRVTFSCIVGPALTYPQASRTLNSHTLSPNPINPVVAWAGISLTTGQGIVFSGRQHIVGSGAQAYVDGSGTGAGASLIRVPFYAERARTIFMKGELIFLC